MKSADNSFDKHRPLSTIANGSSQNSGAPSVDIWKSSDKLRFYRLSGMEKAMQVLDTIDHLSFRPDVANRIAGLTNSDKERILAYLVSTPEATTKPTSGLRCKGKDHGYGPGCVSCG